MHMAMWSRHSATRDPKQDLNLSSFLELEIEAGHDFYNNQGVQHGVHRKSAGIRDFAKYNQRDHKDLQVQSIITDKV